MTSWQSISAHDRVRAATARRVAVPEFRGRVALLRVAEPDLAECTDEITARISELAEAVTAAGGVLVSAGRALPGWHFVDTRSPSVFFATQLLTTFVSERVDTVVLCGGTVSGRVRASAVDAFSYGFGVVVVEDATFDPYRASAEIGLFDIGRLYAALMPSTEIVTRLRRGDTGTPAHAPLHQHTSHTDTQTHGHEHEHGSAAYMTALPPVVLAALPPGAVPTATVHHPVHGHVLDKAGDSVITAVKEQIARSMDDAPHVVVTVRAEDTGSSPDLARALAQTHGGVLIVGVSYQLDAAEALGPVVPPVPGSGALPPGEACPECGAPPSRTELAPTQPGGTPVLLYVCDECGTAWDS